MDLYIFSKKKNKIKKNAVFAVCFLAVVSLASWFVASRACYVYIMLLSLPGDQPVTWLD